MECAESCKDIECKGENERCRGNPNKVKKIINFLPLSIYLTPGLELSRDVTTGATGATAVAPKFSDTLTLSPPRGADSAHHPRGRI